MRIGGMDKREPEWSQLEDEALYIMMEEQSNLDGRLLIAEILSERTDDGSGKQPNNNSLDGRGLEK